MNGLCRINTGRAPSVFRVFDELLSDPIFGVAATNAPGVSQTSALAVDVAEDDSAVTVQASLPGFRKEDVEIQVHDGVLSISAKREESQTTEGQRFVRRERRVGSVSRLVSLPAEVDDSQAQAELVDGVLTLKLPKTAKAQPRKVVIR